MNLAKIRENRNMTQEAVARAAGIQRASYANIEQGRRRPSVSTAQRIASVLDFDWTDFFSGEKTDRKAV